MSNNEPDHPPGLTELLQALVQVGRIAEAMLARRAAEPTHEPPALAKEQRPAAAEAPAAQPAQDALTDALGAPSANELNPSRPGRWHDSVPSAPRQFFTKHAAERMHERYGVPFQNMLRTMAALSHQIRGTHFDGIEGVNLGRRPPSEGAAGSIWAVDIFRQPGFVVVDDDGVIVTVLPRDSKQLQTLSGAARAALEAFRTELHLHHYAIPVSKGEP